MLSPVVQGVLEQDVLVQGEPGMICLLLLLRQAVPPARRRRPLLGHGLQQGLGIRGCQTADLIGSTSQSVQKILEVFVCRIYESDSITNVNRTTHLVLLVGLGERLVGEGGVSVGGPYSGKEPLGFGAGGQGSHQGGPRSASQ